MRRKELLALLDRRECFVCCAEVPEGRGVYHAFLGILTHQESCAEAVKEVSRDYSHSTRGRWNSRAKALGLLEDRRKS